jgi:hypothetical protein
MELYLREKNWVTPEVRRLIEQRNCDFLNNRNDYHKLKSQTQNSIRRANKEHAQGIEQNMTSNSRMAWSQLKCILKIKSNVKGCSLDANTWNQFF